MKIVISEHAKKRLDERFVGNRRYETQARRALESKRTSPSLEYLRKKFGGNGVTQKIYGNCIFIFRQKSYGYILITVIPHEDLAHTKMVYEFGL